ncbi:MAG: transcriptional repressor LexA [Tepidanaerobacteraceae bacterium]|jgi:DNA helicase-2/ATP-dependent DNA helicase PcrA
MQLNMEQRKIINSKPSGHSLIKGVAGSGKTTVSVYRIPFLLNHYCFLPDDAILMVTFNKTLSNYIRYLYEKIDEEEKIDLFNLISEDEGKVQIATVDSLIYKYFCKYKDKNKLKLDISTEKQIRYHLIQQSIFELKKSFPNSHILEQKYSSFLLDEIDWIKSCNYMEIEEYQNADRLGRMNKSSNEEGPQRLQKNSNTRKAIFELMLLFNKKLKEKGLIDIKDAAVFALKEAKQYADKKYSHIIVDESQDLTKVQLEFISCLYQPKEYSSIMFVCDTAQSIYPHSWLVKGRSFTSIGYDMTGKSTSLSKNYRTTTQISQAAYSLIQNDPVILEDDNFVAPSLIDRQGTFPVYRAFANVKQEAEFIANEIKDYLMKQYELKDIAVIAKNKSQLIAIKEHFDKHGITSTIFDSDLDFEEDSAKLLTIHSIKGLEFKVVFIIGLNRNVIPYVTYLEPEDQQVQITTDRKLLYVGMTRANELLYMSSSRAPSQFIREIDSKLLKLSIRNLIRSFYPISIEEYCFKHKIHNLFNNEERVRQWYIKELQDTYKYPIKLIEIEYPVNSFSKTGAVDIAVCIYGKNGTKVPFIFIEVKAYGTDIEKGVKQLKSYMSNEKTCSYGVATNGREVVVLNSVFDIIDDIPSFNSYMLPNSLENFNYIDIKHGRTCLIERDVKSKQEIEVTEQQDKKFFSANDTRQFMVYGNIAAGLPIHMNSSVEDKFYLPADWFNPNDDLFILKVRGDSMIGANIEDGDYVVIKKQEDAGNRDIVAVSLTDDATLKRFVKMGDSVLLMPENEEYEPIQIRTEQARIVGIVCGIIKRVYEHM